MKRYKLLKDLPNLKKGTILSEDEPIFGVRTLTTEDNDVDVTFISDELFEELFEEIQKPTDSIHWKPKFGDRCFILENANIRPTLYTGMLRDYNAWRTGRVFRTEEECEKACDRELAEVRLRRTSTFKPDFYNGMFAYTVGYNCSHKRLYVTKLLGVIIGNPIIYESPEEAEKSIKENREDWLIYFGVDLSDTDES